MSPDNPIVPSSDESDIAKGWNKIRRSPTRPFFSLPDLLAEYCLDGKVVTTRAFQLYCYFAHRVSKKELALPKATELAVLLGISRQKVYGYMKELQTLGLMDLVDVGKKKWNVRLLDPVPAIRRQLQLLAAKEAQEAQEAQDQPTQELAKYGQELARFRAEYGG